MLNEITIEELLERIDMTNNGYIWMPTMMMKKCAWLNRKVVEFDGDCLKRIGTYIERH